MTEVQIRPLTRDDFRGFHACLDAVCRERKWLGRVEASPLEDTREWLADGLEKGEIRLVAVDGGRVVGWIDIMVEDIEGFTHVGRLGMGVLKRYRGRGIGQTLFEAALHAAQDEGLERVELDVYASNTAAISLYEKFGFEVEGRKRRARKLDGEYDDMLIMARLLEE